jgi:hypothetical protein
MSKHSLPTRRTFLKGGALVAAPIAAASVTALALAQDQTSNELNARMRRLEDEAAIREVHQSWLRQINAGQSIALLGGSVMRVIADHAGRADRIEIATDGSKATGRFDCVVDVETRLPEDSTLGQMAHAQGTGAVRSTERRMLTVEYHKQSGVWTVAKVGSRAT